MFETFNVSVGVVVRLRRDRAPTRVDVPTALSKRRKTVNAVVKDWFFHDARKRRYRVNRAGRRYGSVRSMRKCERKGDAQRSEQKPTSESRRGKHVEKQGVHWTPRRGPPVPGGVMRMKRGRWQGEPGLCIEGVQTESRWLRSVRTGSSWPRPSRLSRRRSRQSHGQSRRRVFTCRFCSFLQIWHVQVVFLLETDAPRGCSVYSFSFCW